MFARVSKICLVLALVVTLGAHWAFLQTVAWTAMLANNLRTESVAEAVSLTFDGDHLCPLCKVIAAGKKSENKNAFVPQTQKMEFPPLTQEIVLPAPPPTLIPSLNTFSVKSLTLEPLLPPPRRCFI